MKTAHKIRMNPTAEQVDYLKRACGTRRFIYNWGREHWEAEYQAYKLEQERLPEAERTLKPPNAMGLKKQFNALRETAYPWSYDVTKCVVEGAFDDLEKAYANFFAGRAQYPKYKKKGKSHESFYLSNDKFAVGSHWISIPGLGRFLLTTPDEQDRGKLRRNLGTVNLSEKLRFVEEGKAPVPSKHRNRRKQVPLSAGQDPRGDGVLRGRALVRRASSWISRNRFPPLLEPVVGVDVGLKTVCRGVRWEKA